MTENKEKLSGVFAPVVTPFLDENVSLENLRENLRTLRRRARRGF